MWRRSEEIYALGSVYCEIRLGTYVEYATGHTLEKDRPLILLRGYMYEGARSCVLRVPGAGAADKDQDKKVSREYD